MYVQQCAGLEIPRRCPPGAAAADVYSFRVAGLMRSV